MSKTRDIELAVADGIKRVRADFPKSFASISDANLKVVGSYFVEARMEREGEWGE